MLRNMTGIYIINQDKILLLYRIGSRVVNPSWCGIGGHFEQEELNNPRACVLRELFEETKITSDDICELQMRYISLRLKDKEIRQNYYFFAKLNNPNIILKECDEGVLEWVSISNALEREMPLSAKYCLQHYFTVGNKTNKVYAGVTTENGVNWTEFQEF